MMTGSGRGQQAGGPLCLSVRDTGCIHSNWRREEMNTDSFDRIKSCRVLFGRELLKKGSSVAVYLTTTKAIHVFYLFRFECIFIYTKP